MKKKNFKRQLGGALVAACSIYSGVAYSIGSLTLLNPRPTASDLAEIAYGNGHYVAVGDEKTLIHSLDGVNWEVASEDMNSADIYNDVIHDGSRFIAVSNFEVVTSVDGVNWTVASGNGYYRIAFDGSQYVLADDGGNISLSPDLVSLTPVHTGVWWNELEARSGLYVATGFSGVVAVSTDGVSWVDVDIDGADNNRLDTVAATANTVAVGASAGLWFAPLTSDLSDPASWSFVTKTQLGFFPNLQLGSLGSGFVALDSYLYQADEADLTSWSQMSLTPNGDTIRFAYNDADSSYAMAGYKGMLHRYDPLSGVDEVVAGGYDNFTDITFGNGRYLIAASDATGKLMSTSDFETWSWVDTGAGSAISDVIYAGDKFIACGNVPVQSVDGDTWQVVPGLGPCKYLASDGAGTIVASGTNDAYYSTDNGVTWNSDNIDVFSLTSNASLRYINGHYVATFSTGGVVAVSADGVVWREDTTTAASFIDAAAVGDRVIAVGGDTTNIWFTDNIADPAAWVEDSPPATNRNFSFVSSFGNEFIAAATNVGLLCTSSTGQGGSWACQVRGSQQLNDLLRTDVGAYLVGNVGTVYAMADVMLSETLDSTAVAEGGAGDTVNITLATQPVENVTLSLSNYGETVFTPTSLTFTAANWNVPQEVAVAAIQDQDIEGGHGDYLVVAMDTLDADYSQVTPRRVYIAVSDDDTAPAVTSGQSFALPENYLVTDTFGPVLATDADGDAIAGYMINSSPDASLYRINTDGTIYLTREGALDYESGDREVLLSISATDGVNYSAPVAVTLVVQNANDNAPTLADAAMSVAEDAAVDTVVGSVTGQDVDGDSLSYAIVAGDDAAQFAIDNSGQITVAAALDFETTEQYLLTVDVSDGLFSAQAVVTVTVTDVAESSGGGGGGAVNPLLLLLAGLGVVAGRRRAG